MENIIRFGPAGASLSFAAEGHKHTYEMPAWLNARGLNAFEYSFGRGVNIGEASAKKIAAEAMKYDVQISVHAPYYVNFASPEEPKVENSYRFVHDSLRALTWFGGERCVVHTATKGKAEYADAVALAKSRLYKVAQMVADEFPDKLVCFETMGKRSQIGDVEDILDFCTISPNFIPTFDFGHINSRECGVIRAKDDYRRIIDRLFAVLGEDKARRLHVHFSKIEYSQAGEIRHLTFEDTKYGPDFNPLAELFAEYKMTPVVICESSGTQAEDAASMRDIYKNIV